MPSEPTAISADTRALMLYESQKKSIGLSYLLWVFLGTLGGHRFYNGRTGSGVAMLILTVLGWLTLVAVVGGVLLIAVGIWVIVDAFLIPGWVKTQNLRLISALESNKPVAMLGVIG